MAKKKTSSKLKSHKAAMAYDKAACELHGEFSSLNFDPTKLAGERFGI